MNYEEYYGMIFPNVTIIINPDNYQNLFKFLVNIKEISSDFFDCEFKHNICKRNRLYGCCSICMVNYGFYKYDTFLLEYPDKILDYFSFYRNEHKYGFLNLREPNKGCSLPRYIRSNPCNIFKCYNPSDLEIREKALKYDELISSINNYFKYQDNIDKEENEIINDLKFQNQNHLEFFNLIP